jgi:hypothetical protein
MVLVSYQSRITGTHTKNKAVGLKLLYKHTVGCTRTGIINETLDYKSESIEP